MIRTVGWQTKSGKLRRIRLYMSWHNLRARVNGTRCAGNGSRPWAGLPNNFTGWREFRAWAIANGYSKVRNSLDRKDASQGYGPDNCQWLSVEENTRKMNEDWAKERTLHPEGVRSNEWTDQQRYEGVPF